VAIGLGSNLGDRLDYLRFGVGRLERVLENLRTSSVYETAPVGYPDQPRFLNACCVGQTGLTERQLLSELQDAERAAGRRRASVRYGPRTLDLDLLLYGDRSVHDEQLTLPHARLRERAFVLVPLAELTPDWVVPAGSGREAATVAELARALEPVDMVSLEVEL
jgi:2-amino-4-hydroxy-6-hydroxymethyldihydropteridine diphosphokinase